MITDDDFVPISNEQRKLFNIEIINSENEKTGTFFHIDTQEALVEGLFKLSFDEILKQNSKEGSEVDVDLAIENAIKTTANLGKKLYLDELPENHPLYINKPFANLYLGTWFAREQFKDFVKRKFDALNIDINNIRESLFEDNNEIDDYQAFIQFDTESTERDPKETMSKRVKLFLATMPEFVKAEDGSFKPVRNAVGMQKLYGYENIYEKLVETMSSQYELTFDKIIEKLTLFPEKNPTFYMLAQKLANVDERIQNEFVVALDKINAEQVITMLEESGSGGEDGLSTNYRMYTMKANRNTYTKKILALWEEDQKRSASLMKMRKGEIDYSTNQILPDGLVVDSDKIRNISEALSFLNGNTNLFLNDKYKKELDLKKESHKLLKDIIGDIPQDTDGRYYSYSKLADYILEGIGITLSEDAKEDLYSGKYVGSPEYKYYNGKSIISQFSYDNKGKPTGLMSDILRILEGESDFEKSEEEVDSNLRLRNPLYISKKEVGFLAELQGKYSDIVTTTHLTVEGKKVYDYLLPNFQFKEFLRIKNDAQYRQELANDIFASNSYLYELMTKEDTRNEYKLGLFEALKNEITDKGIPRDKMSMREQFLVDFYNFYNEGKDTANYFDLTKSDKKTTPFHTGVKKLYRTEALLQYEKIFTAEYQRIQSGDSLNVSKQFKNGFDKFYLLPEFNYSFLNKMVEDGILTSKDVNFLYDKKGKIKKIDFESQKFYDFHEKVTDIIIQKKLDSINEAIERHAIDIDTTSKKDILEQYAYNSHIFNLSISMLYSGDVALFSKGNPDNVEGFIASSYDQYTKRLAKDIAPGIKPSFSKPTYTAITLKATNRYSKEYEKLFLNKYYGKEDNGSGQIDPSDAAQFCTVERYFEIMYALGRVPKGVYDGVLEKTRKGSNYRLTPIELSYIQPLKPVEVNRGSVIIDEDSNKKYNYINYVKSSLIALVPNLTSGYEIDNLRLMMESNKIDQANLDSAGKSGNPVVAVQPYDIDNNFIPDSLYNLEKAKRTMNSSAFYIQQEIPYDFLKKQVNISSSIRYFSLEYNELEKTEICVSQNLEKYFGLKSNLTDGSTLLHFENELKLRILTDTMKSLNGKIGFSNFNLQPQKQLYSFLLKYIPLNSYEKIEFTLNKDKFSIPLLFNRYSNLAQSTINSAFIKNLRTTLESTPFVGIPSIGMKKNYQENLCSDKIIPFKSWKNRDLLPLRAVVAELFDEWNCEIYLNSSQLQDFNNGSTFRLSSEQKELLVQKLTKSQTSIISQETTFSGKILPAQVIIPISYFNSSFFYDENLNVEINKKLRIEDFINDDGELVAPSGLKNIIGLINNNAFHHTLIPFEVVALLPSSYKANIFYYPNEYGDLFALSQIEDSIHIFKSPFLKTPSNSFQFDTLNSHLKLNIYKDLYFDVIFSLITNPIILQCLHKKKSYDDISVYISLKKREHRFISIFDRIEQLKLYSINQTKFCLLSKLHYLEDFMVKIADKNCLKVKHLNLTINNICLASIASKSLYENEITNDNKFRKIKSIILEIDKLEYINLTPTTFSAFCALSLLQDENGKYLDNFRIFQILNNPVIKFYSNEIRNAEDSFSPKKGFSLTCEKTTLQKFKINHPLNYEHIELSDEDLGIITDQNGIILKINEPPYKSYSKILSAFIIVTKLGDEIIKLQYSLSFSNNGIGKNIHTGNILFSTINSYLKNNGTKYIKGYKYLFMSNTSTNELSVIVQSTSFFLKQLNSLWEIHMFDKIFNKIFLISGKHLDNKDKSNITNHFVSFFLSKTSLWTDNYLERKRIFFSSSEQLSLARRMTDIKEQFPQFQFFRQLETKLGERVGQPDYIKYRILDKNTSHDRILREFLILTESSNDKIRTVIHDLIRYSLISGGNTTSNSFFKLIPAFFFINNSHIFYDSFSENEINSDRFIEQFFQHNPTLAIDVNQFKNSQNIGKSRIIIAAGYSSPLYIHSKYYDKLRKVRKVKLFKKDISKSTDTIQEYFHVDTLGNYYLKEYDFTNDDAKSILTALNT